MRPVIVIPTYWARKSDKYKSIFDHPTTSVGKSTLERCLRSIQNVGIEQKIILFPSPMSRDIEDKLVKIASGFRELDIEVFRKRDLDYIKDTLRRFPREFSRYFRMNDYPDIRNTCFAMALLKKADVVIQLDDDITIDDPDFIQNCKFSIGDNLLGKTGFYVNRNGSWIIRQKNLRTRKLWLKETFITDALRKSMESRGRIVPTTFALGGNMVIHKKLFMKVPYDPFNTRGEDTDYMINCKHFGYRFLFDKRLIVRHMPPKRIAPYWTKFRQDLYRFIYEREKLREFGMDPSDFDPYPGVFLKDDLEERITITCNNYARECLKGGHPKDAGEWKRNSNEILEHARKTTRKHEGSYLGFQKNWKDFMKDLK